MALDNWSWIADPITKELLQGRTFDLAFKYHNSIKRSLFQALAPTNDKVLLDIGSGQGGDAAKWRNFGKSLQLNLTRGTFPNFKTEYENWVWKIRFSL